MKVEKGNRVKVSYEGRFEDGEVFDSSAMHGNKPLEFTAGTGEVIEGFDQAVVGMEKGEEKEITINSKEAYGEYNPILKRDIPNEMLPKDNKPKVGMMLMIHAPDGREFPVKIIGVNDDGVTIDLNHPLAGKNLVFKIRIEEIIKN